MSWGKFKTQNVPAPLLGQIELSYLTYIGYLNMNDSRGDRDEGVSVRGMSFSGIH